MSKNNFLKKIEDKIGYRADENDVHEKRLELAQTLEDFGSLPMLIVSGFLQKSVGGMFFNGALAFAGIVLAWILPSNTLFNVLLFLCMWILFKLIFAISAVDKAVTDVLKDVSNKEIIYEKLLKRLAKHSVCLRNSFRSIGLSNQLSLMIIVSFFAFFIPLPVFFTIGLLIVALFPVYNIISKQEAERFLASPPVSPRIRTNMREGLRSGVPDSLVTSLRNDQDGSAQLTTSLIPPPPPPAPAYMNE